VELKLDLLTEQRAKDCGVEDLYYYYKNIGSITQEMADNALDFYCVG